jgi:hypothetical protein
MMHNGSAEHQKQDLSVATDLVGPCEQSKKPQSQLVEAK